MLVHSDGLEVSNFNVISINPLMTDRGRIDLVILGFRSTPFSRACFAYKRYYLIKQIHKGLCNFAQKMLT